MWLEGHHGGFDVALIGGFSGCGEQRLMTAMHAVEVTDRDGARHAAGRARQATPHSHRFLRLIH
jgi:hypothetical protein